MEPATIDEAVALLKERPDNVDLHHQLAGLYFTGGKMEKAWEVYVAGLRLDPDDPFTCLYFGNLFDDLRRQILRANVV